MWVVKFSYIIAIRWIGKDRGGGTIKVGVKSIDIKFLQCMIVTHIGDGIFLRDSIVLHVKNVFFKIHQKIELVL